MEELDIIVNEINKNIDEQHNIIIASASSRLWEGANIKDVHLLIIDALPYPRPSLEEANKGIKGWFKGKTF